MRPGNATAIISGKTVAEGDMFDGNKIVKIEAARVILQNAQGNLFSISYQ